MIALNVLALIPTVPIGVIGGVLGSLFTFCSVKFTRWSVSGCCVHCTLCVTLCAVSICRRAGSAIKGIKWRQILEPAIVVLLFATM